MKCKLLAILIANMFVVTVAEAADGAGDFTTYGSLSVGYRAVNDHTKDGARLNEYRDVSDGPVGVLDLHGRGNSTYLDFYGENLGRDDMLLDFKGGAYGMGKFRLYRDDIVHNITFGARTPLTNVGSSNLGGVLPNLGVASWNSFDFGTKRKNLGGMVEYSGLAPWYLRADYNEVREDGLKLIAGALGTSPGNGFSDKPYPVSYLTRNYSVEGGYSSKTAQLGLNLMHSRFTNDNETLMWRNQFFGGQDTSVLPPDNEYTKISANGMLKQLPLGSTLSGRLTYSRTKSNVDILQNILSTGGATPATSPDRSSFEGKVIHRTASVSLYSNPTKALDTRVYWNWYDKDNRSPVVTFTPSAPSGLRCGGAACVTEILDYRKNNIGVDVGYRINADNRVIAGFDYVDLRRDRVDFDETKDKKYTLEYRNTSLDELAVRAKYQRLQRRSHFLEGSAGTGPNDVEFLNRFVARFDASNVDQDMFKVALDYSPTKLLDFGFEGILKQNRYKDTVLGRTKDDREEFYLSAAYGDINEFRVLVFADVEFIQYDSTHRNISSVAAADAYDPSAPATNTNYNWSAKNRDRNYAVGLGADWKATSRLKFNGSATWEKTKGTVDFSVQQGGNATNEVPIGNFDNATKLSVNLKGTYAFSKKVELTAGYAFERFRFSDIAVDDYRYTVGAGNSTSYLSGYNAYTNYTTNIVYVLGTLHFE
ncbi:MAG: MtrB/PioB family outer membrane beta-barrel protein [Rhodocyclaceae bacterium]|nr:MtrB/PioB family outer membrane beta-barrel protein [Rhodocyclaceae bacterium]